MQGHPNRHGKYGKFWAHYFAKQGVDVHGRPLRDDDDLQRRVRQLERLVDELLVNSTN
jgi:hypothetical protein